MKKYLEILQTQIGFSLIEILVAIGLAGGLTLYLVNLSQYQLKIQKTADFRAQATEIFYEISSLLKKESACFISLSGSSPGDNIPELRFMDTDTDEGVIAKMGAEYRSSGIIVDEIKFLTPLTTGPNVASFDLTTGEGAFLLEVTIRKRSIEKAQAVFGTNVLKRQFPVQAKYNRRASPTPAVLTSQIESEKLAAAVSGCAAYVVSIGSVPTPTSLGPVKNPDGTVFMSVGMMSGNSIPVGTYECTWVDSDIQKNELDSCTI